MELFLFGSLACCLSFHNPLAVLAILLRLSLCALQQFPAIQQDVSLQSSHYLIPDTEACLTSVSQKQMSFISQYTAEDGTTIALTPATTATSTTFFPLGMTEEL